MSLKPQFAVHLGAPMSLSSSSDSGSGDGDGSGNLKNLPRVVDIDALAARLGTVTLGGSDQIEKARAESALSGDFSAARVAQLLRDGAARKVIVMAGAGISVSAGIPDFRTPGTGLYDNLAKYDLPEPTAIFDIEFYREKPEPFSVFAREIYPGNFRPTLSHYFSLLLHRRGILLRHFTQNIDTLERVAGVPDEALVEAHGSFHGAHCIDCRAEADTDAVRRTYLAQEVPRCAAKDGKCNGLVKPDIVFFGEGLPGRFFRQMKYDFPECDLLLVLGTSLQVTPFASLIHMVKDQVPRVLMNRERVGTANSELLRLGVDCDGFRFKVPEANVRDVAMLGDLDDLVWELVAAVGQDWLDDLVALVREKEGKDSLTRKLLEERLLKSTEKKQEGEQTDGKGAPAAAAADTDDNSSRSP